MRLPIKMEYIMLLINADDPVDVCFIEKTKITQDQLQVIRSAHGKKSDYLKGFDRKTDTPQDGVTKTIFEIIPDLQQNGFCVCVKSTEIQCKIPESGIVTEIISCKFTC